MNPLVFFSPDVHLFVRKAEGLTWQPYCLPHLVCIHKYMAAAPFFKLMLLKLILITKWRSPLWHCVCSFLLDVGAMY